MGTIVPLLCYRNQRQDGVNSKVDNKLNVFLCVVLCLKRVGRKKENYQETLTHLSYAGPDSCSTFFLSDGSCQRMTAKLWRPIVFASLELINTMLSVFVLSLDFCYYCFCFDRT